MCLFHRLLLSFALLIATFAQAQQAACTTTDKKINKVLQEALNAPSFEEKAKALATVAQKYPENVQAYYYLGVLFYAKGSAEYKNNATQSEGERKLQKSLAFFQASIQKCPDYDPEAYYYSAKLLYNFDRKEASLTQIETYFTFDSIFPASREEGLETYEEHKSELAPLYKELRFLHNAKLNPVPYEVQKVQQVSTTQDEYFPMLSPDNELLFFTRKADKTNLGDISGGVEEEFTMAQAQQEQFNQGYALSSPFNDGNFYNYGSASLSADNREMILCACKKEIVYQKEYLNCDLYSTRYQVTQIKGKNTFSWGPLTNLGPQINTKDGWEAQPSLSSDGKLLYFTSYRKGSQDNDIYYSEKQADGSWGPAKPFTLVNTAGKDKSPFFHQDGETFYFVSESNRERPGMGGLDIFYMRKTDTGWGPIENLGFPINSEADELGLFVSTNGKEAYFSSFQGQNWDIYSFELYEAARPKEVRILTGKIIDETGKGVAGANLQLNYHNREQQIEAGQTNEDGTYAIAVQVGEDISISASKENHSFQAQVIKAEELSTPTNKVEAKALVVDSLEVGKAYTLASIYYATESHLLDKEAKILLQGFAKYLQQQQNISLQINGHTDDLGAEQNNLILSERRAQEVVNYLIELGVAPERLQAKGFGETQPKVANTSSENRAKNRRTDFEILGL
jgi:outer membrane protein OmpA-like peptidoglycan-associated protein/Tol biopolymer transport system component